MRFLTHIGQAAAADRVPASQKVVLRPKRRLRRELFAATVDRSGERPDGDPDDPLHESWQKLLAKYRRR